MTETMCIVETRVDHWAGTYSWMPIASFSFPNHVKVFHRLTRGVTRVLSSPESNLHFNNSDRKTTNVSRTSVSKMLQHTSLD